MKKVINLIAVLSLIMTIACQNQAKKETQEKKVEVKIERTEEGSKAEITTTKWVEGETIEEIEIIEGTHEEVMKKVEALTTEDDVNKKVVRKTKKQLQFKLNAKSDTNTEGKVLFTEEEGTVTLNAMISGLTEGTHAIHIHEKADCSSPDGKSTGGHWNPTFQPHGAWGSSEGYHRGDIGNFEADNEGNGEVTFATDQWCLGCDDETKNIIGKAIIVHQGADDLTSQPSGAAGSRISCAGIIR
jgi:Cu-Zn family superoxide dismutase